MIGFSEIATRHPGDLRCKTDQAYAKLAEKIYDELYGVFCMAEKERILRKASISMSLYFEDLMSGTHQMKVFEKLYKKMFGFYMPFFQSEDDTSPTAELDAATFVLWHSLSGDADGQIWNPSNDNLRSEAKKLLELFHKERPNLPANEDLVNFLYSEETLENPYEIRDILVWIESRSFLGKWLTNSKYDDGDSSLHLMLTVFKGKLKKTLQNMADYLGAFGNQAWPLSLSAAEIYAEMIRTEMEDPEDCFAAKVEKIESSPFMLYHIEKAESTYCLATDTLGKTYNIQYQSKEDKKIAPESACVACGLFSYDGKWYPNGLYRWTGLKSKSEFEIYTNLLSKQAETEKEEDAMFKEYNIIANRYVEKKSGQRLYFFKKRADMEKWTLELFGRTPNIPNRGNEFMMFIEPDGTTVSITEGTYAIKHPDNPYYDKENAKNNALMPWETGHFSPELTLYLVEHNLVPDACFYDFKGEKHGCLLFQDNIDFLIRCFRRDIKRKDVFHSRKKDLFADFEKELPETPKDKKSLLDFVDEINTIRTFKSKGGKKDWRIEKCDADNIVIIDPVKIKVYTIQTRKLYDAYVALEPPKMNVQNLTPYIGKENGSAAAALLYNVVGIGSIMASFRRLAEVFGRKDWYLK